MALGDNPPMAKLIKKQEVTEAKQINNVPFRSPARPPARLLVPPLPPVRPLAGPPACLASTRPGLARPVAARLGSTWLRSGSAR